MKTSILSLFCLLASLPALAAPAIPLPAGLAHTESAGTVSAPETLDTFDWSGIRAAHEAWQREIREQEDGTFAAHHPGQQWRTSFDGSGFTVQPDEGGWTWGLELRGYGAAAGEITKLSQPEGIVSDENRLVRRWGRGLQEWYLNRSEGLQQGWTVAAPPEGTKAKDELRLEFAVRGDLSAQVSASESDLGFVDGDGATVLTYGGLVAWDAEGKAVPVRFVAVGQGGDRIAVEADTREARFPVTIDPIAQQAYLKASNTAAADWFGHSVSVSGDTVVVGAPFEDSAAATVNGDGSNNGALESGAAYVFVRNGSSWTQQAYLKAATGVDAHFGISVSISGDTVVVGARSEDSTASNSGAAYVFVRSGGNWSQQAFLKAFNVGAEDAFGSAVAVSGDILVVGANSEDSNAIGIGGDGGNNSAENSGAAYVFARTGVSWTPQAYLKASNTGTFDRFGISVAVFGETVAVGASGERSNAVGVNGDGNNNDAFLSGAAYVFVRDEMGDWSQQAYLKASNTGGGDNFGVVSVFGDTVVVGAPNESSDAIGVGGDENNDNADASGAAYVFVRDEMDVWSQEAYLKASNTRTLDSFGNSVSVSGDTIVVSATNEDSIATGIDGDEHDDEASGAGAAYVFVRDEMGDWSQQAYLKASNTGAGDYFGSSVSVSGDTIVVGAHLEDSGTTGINSNGGNNDALHSGAAYIFDLDAMLVDTPTPPPPVVDNSVQKTALSNKVKKLTKKFKSIRKKGQVAKAKKLQSKIKKLKKKLKAL